MPPPEAVEVLTRLPLTVQPDIVRKPVEMVCTQIPPPPPLVAVHVLSRIVVSVTATVVPWMKMPPPPFPPFAVLLAKSPPVIVVVPVVVWMRTAPPSADEPLFRNAPPVIETLVVPIIYT